SLGDGEPLGAYVRAVAPPAVDDSDREQAGAAFAQRVADAFEDLRRHGFAPAVLLMDSLLCSDGLIPHPAGFLAPAADAARAAGALAERYPVLRDVRGAGLYVGADVVDPATGLPSTRLATAIVNGMRVRRVLISSANREGTALKVRPPLPFGSGDAAELLAAL